MDGTATVALSPTVDEWQYSELLRVAARQTLHHFEQALRGVDSLQHGAGAPYRLPVPQLREVQGHMRAIEAVLDGTVLEPVPAKAARSPEDGPPRRRR
jgi:hypothetical protein